MIAKKKSKSRPSFRALFKKRAAPAQVSLVKEPRSKLRFVTKSERAEHPELFSPKGSYLVRKSVKMIGKKTVFVRTSDKQDWRINVSHTKAAKLRTKGELGYGPKAEERGVPKSVQTFRLTILKRKYAKLEDAEKPSIPWAKKLSPRKARTYPITDEMRDRFWDLRQQKLDGEFIDDGLWHEMVDQARALRDPTLSLLLKSP